MRQQALEWLYKQLKSKRIALHNAEKNPGSTEEEKANIRKAIEIIEYISAVVLAKGEE